MTFIGFLVKKKLSKEIRDLGSHVTTCHSLPTLGLGLGLQAREKINLEPHVTHLISDTSSNCAHDRPAHYLIQNAWESETHDTSCGRIYSFSILEETSLGICNSVSSEEIETES